MANITVFKEGKKYGQLFVLEVDHKEGYETFYKCLCDCGETAIVRKSNLRENGKGGQQTCGHTRRYRGGGVSVMYGGYKQGAKLRGYEFSLSKEDFSNVVHQDCYYCGKEPSNFRKSVGSVTGEYLSGVDRKVNSKGYTLDNSVPCCSDCNYLKSSKDEEEFLNLVFRISDFRRKH